MDFWPIFIKMMELFLIIIVGYVANRVGVFTTEIKRALTKVVLYVTLPGTILSSVMNSESLPTLDQIGNLLIVAFLSYLIFYLIGVATSHLLRLKGKEKGAVEFALVFSNVGFVGFPVTYAIFGAPSSFYTCVFNMPFNIMCYSLGVMLLTGELFKRNKSGEKEAAHNSKEKIIKMLKMVLTPSMITAVIALVMAMVGYQGPRIIADTCATIGDITTPAALLIIGIALAEMPIKEMFINVKAYIVSIVSVFVTPVIIYLIFNPFCTNDPLLIGEAVIIAGMPVATAGTMLCVEYGGDEKLMAQMTFISTVLSLVTIPVLAVLLGRA